MLDVGAGPASDYAPFVASGIGYVRVLEPGAQVTIGLWGGRNEIVDSTSSTSGLDLPRHFTLRTHDQIRSLLRRHLVIEREETFASGSSGWREYHVASGSTPTMIERFAEQGIMSRPPPSTRPSPVIVLDRHRSDRRLTS